MCVRVHAGGPRTGATKELDGADAEEDELDADFVTIARPWLHTNAFHDLTGAEDVLSQLWAHVSDAEYLREGGQGGTLLLLLPRAMPLELLQRAAATVQGAVHAHLSACAPAARTRPATEHSLAWPCRAVRARSRPARSLTPCAWLGAGRGVLEARRVLCVCRRRPEWREARWARAIVCSRRTRPHIFSAAVLPSPRRRLVPGCAADAAVHVEPFHPDAEAVPYRSPTPLLRLFLDSPELLVDGSMSDAASFL